MSKRSSDMSCEKCGGSGIKQITCSKCDGGRAPRRHPMSCGQQPKCKACKDHGFGTEWCSCSAGKERQDADERRRRYH